MYFANNPRINSFVVAIVFPTVLRARYFLQPDKPFYPIFKKGPNFGCSRYVRFLCMSSSSSVVDDFFYGKKSLDGPINEYFPKD